MQVRVLPEGRLIRKHNVVMMVTLNLDNVVV